MSFRDELDDLDVIADTDALERKNAKLRRDNSSLRRQLDAADARETELQKLLDFHDALTAAEPSPPKWLTPAKPGKSHRATIVSLLSDTHFDEVVNPDEVGGLNAYDRTIATKRLNRWAEGTITVARDYLAGVKYDGIVIMLGGDIFTGNLHDLAETNEDTLFGSLLYWSEQLAAAITMLADEFGKVHVPVVVGNHGRLTHKPRTKLRARDNMDWLLGHMLALQLASDRITFDIPDSTDTFVDVYGTTHLLTHGDQTTGGGGVGGIWPPIMRMSGRKAQRYAATGKTFDTICMGHWHQLIMAPEAGLIVNGSLKGYDEYAAVSNFRPERPQQAMWLVTPEHGISMSAPVIVGDRKKEKW
ncbi:hypothetical protein UFOVP209_36 [uncultured Caudovirales phage]|uniref:Calcineurin-like phosphoesterase domain, ApaH type n=1 Tax=uncultured Caudovirales phage TaxID=2100421 RepID=A0A6J7WRJ2_9CAUD|nr:hypothetical protein UFOVP209_36 [uncultured Caudovirales phage]